MKQDHDFHHHDFPAPSGAAKHLIIILHGHGSHPSKYKRLAHTAQRENPDADVLLVRAPHAMNSSRLRRAVRLVTEADDLYTWFPHLGKPSEKMRFVLSGVFNKHALSGRLNAFIDRHLQQRGLQDKDLALIGFSMGGGVAVHTAAQRPNPIAALVCHSGAVLPFFKATSKPDTLVLMGDRDRLLYTDDRSCLSTVSKIFNKAGLRLDLTHKATVKRLQNEGLPLTEKIIPNLVHRISDESWKVVTDFTNQRLKMNP